MDKIKADAQEKGDLGIVAEVSTLNTIIFALWIWTSRPR